MPKTNKTAELDQGTVETTGEIGGEASAEQTPAPELTVQDLGNIRSIIDIASQRGAFRASEMAAVGTVYNRLNDFLGAVNPATENA
jgi:hypothetical protein